MDLFPRTCFLYAVVSCLLPLHWLKHFTVQFLRLTLVGLISLIVRLTQESADFSQSVFQTAVKLDGVPAVYYLN
ncbi:hypothetical protein SAMN05661091_5211 [Paenibacillus uliginis N3/975]|uniref:Uncharacterized protein n=1 Tax=Paenibacillus uliginis N3/975 TaxID=1313296 RepID=A0A1X7HQ61_9BACL|nr:hypothetical protein SAMN05661091_5211 [Paenibacillus uliginis N3/975]